MIYSNIINNNSISKQYREMFTQAKTLNLNVFLLKHFHDIEVTCADVIITKELVEKQKIGTIVSANNQKVKFLLSFEDFQKLIDKHILTESRYQKVAWNIFETLEQYSIYNLSSLQLVISLIAKKEEILTTSNHAEYSSLRIIEDILTRQLNSDCQNNFVYNFDDLHKQESENIFNIVTADIHKFKCSERKTFYDAMYDKKNVYA